MQKANNWYYIWLTAVKNTYLHLSRNSLSIIFLFSFLLFLPSPTKNLHSGLSSLNSLASHKVTQLETAQRFQLRHFSTSLLIFFSPAWSPFPPAAPQRHLCLADALQRVAGSPSTRPPHLLSALLIERVHLRGGGGGRGGGGQARPRVTAESRAPMMST